MAFTDALSDGQAEALAQLRRIAEGDPGALAVAPSMRLLGSGILEVDVTVDLSDLPAMPEGHRFRAREHAVIRVPREFPFEGPGVRFGSDRFAHLPHVMWDEHLCLYLTDNDWDPGDGMYGLVDRLADWYVQAARGALQEIGQPLHPPVASATAGAGSLVVTSSMPRPGHPDRPWTGLAVLAQRHPLRCDVRGWCGLAELLADPDAAVRLSEKMASVARERKARVFLALVVVLPRPLDFHYPNTMDDLMLALAERGVRRKDFIALLGHIDRANTAESGNSGNSPPLYALIGAPLRGGAAGTHLAAWRLDVDAAALTALYPLIYGARQAQPAEAAARQRRAMMAFDELTRTVAVSWAATYDQRPETRIRRDAGHPAEWLRDRDVLVLGCGALGARIAEHCVRAGVRRLTLADRGLVNPGTLVRQPYEDDDVGFPKALVLAQRLRRVRPDAEVRHRLGDARRTALDGTPAHDLVVDATANKTVAAHIERLRRQKGDPWPPILTVGVGHDCRRGFAALALPAATGAGADLLNHLAITAFGTDGLRDFAADFFPEPGSRVPFQPEPGCSEPTFTGSDTEASILAAQLFDSALGTLHADSRGLPVSASTVHLARVSGASQTLEWPGDLVLDDESSGYQIRIRPAALESMRAEARTTEQLHGPGVETGGILIGRIDDACRAIWVTAAESPPPDSERALRFFRHGLHGVRERIAEWKAASGGHARFAGMWHTHPGSAPVPSDHDRTSMDELLVPVPDAPARAILVVLGGRPAAWRAWLQGTGAPDAFGCLNERTAPITPRTPHAV